MTVLLLFYSQPASQLSGSRILIYDRTAVAPVMAGGGDVGVGVGTPWIVTTGAVPFPAYYKVSMFSLLCDCLVSLLPSGSRFRFSSFSRLTPVLVQ